MEWIFEIILELIFQGGMDACNSKKIPKGIRYLIFIVVVTAYISAISLLLWIGVVSLNKNVYLGLFFILLCFIMLVMSIIEIKTACSNISNKNNNGLKKK